MGVDKYGRGHLAAFMTVMIWGTTFVSTKVLLEVFEPVEILFFRFAIGYAALWIVSRKCLKIVDKREEFYFAAAGLCGVTLYFLLENFALTFTLAANVGVIVSVSPCFAAVFNWLFLKGEKPGIKFLGGFATAMAGVFLISFRNGDALRLNPAGDVLALLSAVVWAVYATLTKKISSFGYGTVLSTRRTFFYGLLFMIPVILMFPIGVDLEQFMELKYIGNILFLGLGASALCFVTWNYAVKILGSVKTSVYIYMVPVITVMVSMPVLKERLTWLSFCGILMVLTGLGISEGKWNFGKRR